MTPPVRLNPVPLRPALYAWLFLSFPIRAGALPARMNLNVEGCLGPHLRECLSHPCASVVVHGRPPGGVARARCSDMIIDAGRGSIAPCLALPAAVAVKEGRGIKRVWSHKYRSWRVRKRGGHEQGASEGG